MQFSNWLTLVGLQDEGYVTNFKCTGLFEFSIMEERKKALAARAENQTDWHAGRTHHAFSTLLSNKPARPCVSAYNESILSRDQFLTEGRYQARKCSTSITEAQRRLLARKWKAMILSASLSGKENLSVPLVLDTQWVCFCGVLTLLITLNFVVGFENNFGRRWYQERYQDAGKHTITEGSRSPCTPQTDRQQRFFSTQRTLRGHSVARSGY